MNFIKLIGVALFSNFIIAQTENRPKLIIGIVVDQMRAEYLYRFQDNYGENGFKKLLREGFNVKNIDSYLRKNYTTENDDAHLPMLWYGHTIKAGETVNTYSINQIVPTLAMLLNIPLPSSSSKYPIIEIF